MTKEEKERAQKSRAAIFGDGVQGLRNWKKGQLGGWLLLAVALLLTLIIVPKGGLIPDYLAPGEIASRDIKSPRDLLVEDVQLTEAKRMEAAAAVPLVYEFDSLSGSDAVSRINRGLELLLQRQESGEEQDSEAFLQQLQADFGVPLTAEDYRPLIRLPLSQGLAAWTVICFSRFSPCLSWLIWRPFRQIAVGGLSLYDRKNGQELDTALLDQTIDLSDALARAQEELGLIPDISKRQNKRC